MTFANFIRPLLRGAVTASMIVGAAAAQDEAADASAASAPVASDQGENTIVVTGRTEPTSRLEAYEQAREISRVGRYQLYDESLPRFWAPVCPGVAGLKAEHAGWMVGRIRANAEKVGIRVANADCSPNLVVAFVDSGQSLLVGLQRQQPDLFTWLSADEQAELLTEAGPARVFTNMAWRWTDGSTKPPGWPKRRASTRKIDRALPEARDIVSALVVFDRSAVLDLTLVQLADYATMRGLSHTRPADGDEPLGTILALFAESSAGAAELTSFDRAYLHSLYRPAPNARAASNLLAIGARAREDEDQATVTSER